MATRGVNNGGRSVLDNYSPMFRAGVSEAGSSTLSLAPTPPTLAHHCQRPLPPIFALHLPLHPQKSQERPSWRTAWKASLRRARRPKART